MLLRFKDMQDKEILGVLDWGGGFENTTNENHCFL